ncbi:MBL fold metallo-hydrolase [Ideonella sp. DXS29W]|uniref:MBL fold metallo-hydrolase n=1 Tax=Ideonella lacteola TaxID=2984193 RepID=A0ABU9BQL4_9BURK
MFRQLFDTGSSTYTYLLACERTREAVLIDPVLEQCERDVALMTELGVRPRWLLDTHVHADHVTGVTAIKAACESASAATTAVGLACDAIGYERALSHGDRLAFGDEHLDVIATPGHTPGSMSFLWRDRLFTGDALLIGGCGRTDFQGGDAGQLYDAVTRHLFALPGETLVYPGHDYKGRRVSCIAEERDTNARLAGKTRDEFIALMAALNLPRPKLIDIAVPANKQAGALMQG